MSHRLKMSRYKALRYYRSLCDSVENDGFDDAKIEFGFFNLNQKPKGKKDFLRASGVAKQPNLLQPAARYGSMKVLSHDRFSVMLDVKAFGMGQLLQDPFIFVSDQDFVSGVMALSHELCHVKQHLASRNQISYPSFSPDIVVSSVVSHQNPYYYNKAYANLLHELDANAQGFMDGYTFLSDNFSDLLPDGQQGVDKLVLEYLHGRFGRLYARDACESKSIGEAFEKLSGSYSHWFERPKSLTYNSAEFGADNQDEGYAVTHGLSGVPPMCVRQWREAWDAFSYSHDTRDASYRLCAITLRLHPEYLEEFPCLKAVQDDFAFDKLFPEVPGDKFLEPVNDTLDRISECCPRSCFPGCVGENGFSGPPKVFNAKDVPTVQFVSKPNRSVPEAAGILPSRTPDYDSVERPAVRPQSCSGRSLSGLDVDPDNSNNVSNDFERS